MKNEILLKISLNLKCSSFGINKRGKEIRKFCEFLILSKTFKNFAKIENEIGLSSDEEEEQEEGEISLVNI